MSNKIIIRFTNPDLITHFGKQAEVPYDWGIKKVQQGHAVLYQPPPPKVDTVIDTTPQYNQAKTEIPIPTRIRKYPEIVWVQDANIMGGAELSSQQCIKVGDRLGFDIQILTPQSFDLNILRNGKLLIINNIRTFNVTQMVEIKRAIFEFQVPYIKYEHDMRELCDDRLSFSRRLFKQSKLNIFISPLQKQEYQKKIFDMSPACTFPLAIDVDKFKPNPKIKRDMNTIIHASGNLHNKGLPNLLAMTKQKKDKNFLIFVGDSNEVIQMFAGQENVKVMPRVDNDKMADIYSSAGYLVHCPPYVWAGERVILEATLCGCKLLVNENVGHMSWGWDLADTDALRERLRQAPYEFWRQIEKCLNNT